MDNFKLARRAARTHNLQPPSARLVLTAVAVYVNGDPAYPSYQRLADDTGLSAVRVRNYLADLVKAGYLAQTRRPTGKDGGWGQPQWVLGPLCQVLTSEHSQVVTDEHLNGRVLTPEHSSAHPRALASAHQRAQKRVSSGKTQGSGETGNGGGKSTTVVKRTTEKKGPHPTQVRVGDMIDALKAVGLPSELTAPERSALLATDLPAAEIAACMQAINEGALGDQWDRDHLTVNQGIKLHRGWKTRQQAPPPAPTGTTGAILRWSQNRRNREENARADDRRPVRPALPSPRPGV